MVTEEGNKHSSKLPLAQPLLHSVPKDLMEWIRRLQINFWVVFFLLFVPLLFVPVYPIRHHTNEVFWVAPIWAAYLFSLLVPLIASPIIVLHISICFYIARFAVPGKDRDRSIKLSSLIALVTVVSVSIGITNRFGEVGFVSTFLVLTTAISVANIFFRSRWCGVLYPKLSPGVARVLLGLCLFLTIIGSTFLASWVRL